MMDSILLSSLLILSMIGVRNTPGSIVVSEFRLTVNDTNKDLTFNCHHPAAGNIDFRVLLSNGMDVTRQINSGIVHNNCFQNGLRYTVTIPGQPQYIGAQVHCLVMSDAQLESPPAFTLTKTSRRTKNVSIGEVATFECASCSRIDWLVNVTDLRSLTVAYKDINITSRLAADGSTRISTLFIVGRLIYNDTSIECRATGADQHLPPVQLFVQARPCPENLSLKSHLVVSEKMAEIILTAHLNSSSTRVSNTSSVDLDSLDGQNSTQLIVPSSYRDQMLTLILTVARRRIWNASVVDHCKFSGIELNTHDIRNIQVSSPLPGTVRVTGEFIQGSTATGIIMILYRWRDSYVTYDLISRKKDMLVTDITHVGNGHYEVFAFDVEGNGTYSSATVKPIVVNVMPSDLDEAPSLPRIEYEVQNMSTGFLVTCIFLDRRITECVVIVHQRFPLRHNFLSASLYHFRLGSVGNMVTGYVYVADPNDIQITVVGGTKKTRRTSTSSIPSWAIAVIAVVSCCSLLMLGLGGIVMAKAKLMHKSRMKCQVIEEIPEDGSETQHPAAGPTEEKSDRTKPPPTDHSEPLVSAPNVPEEESDKEVKHRTHSPLPSNRRNLGDDGRNYSDDMRHPVTPFVNIERQPSLELRSQPYQKDHDDHGNRSTTPPHVDDRNGIPGSISHQYEDSELDDDDKDKFPPSIEATEKLKEARL